MPVGPTAPTDVRAATPDLTIVSSARYDVQPDKRRVRVTIDLTLTQPPQGHDHQALLLRPCLPRCPAAGRGLKLTTAAAAPRSRSPTKTKSYTMLRLDLGAAPVQRQDRQVPTHVRPDRPGGGARPATCGSATRWCRSRSGPSRRTSTPGSSVTVVFPTGYDVKVEAGKIAAPTTDSDGRDDLPKRTARQAARFLRLSRGRPAGRLPRDHSQHRHPGHAGRGPGPRPGRTTRLVEAGRRPAAGGIARARASDRPGLARRTSSR